PELLELLELEGAMVTLDAMSCQKQIVKTIVKKKADYCIAVKKNQKSLYQALQDAFELSDSNESGHLEQEHGRVEYRAYDVLSALELPASMRSAWSSLETIGRATYYRLANGKEQLQYRYYISSARLSAEQFASTVRAHWGVENRLHWVLDVTMREDDCPISRGHAADNLACFRHVALNQIRREKSIKASVNRKQKMATMSEEVLDLIVNA
ncbi:MAG: ISAs1 family transposase, partial [Gammaproteobacteria bacterium]|nr:ISAs1 family transposase [Gammaproteobacteria bacterium]